MPFYLLPQLNLHYYVYVKVGSAVKKDSKNGAARKFFGPSHFEMALGGREFKNVKNILICIMLMVPKKSMT